MGQASSIASCKNDFELVIRATKELEWLLETHFGAPDGKNVGLHDKISAARDPRNQKPLPEKIIRRMRKLFTIRNALVHDRFTVDRRAMTDRFASHTDVARAGSRGVSTRVTSSNQNTHTRAMS